MAVLLTDLIDEFESYITMGDEGLLITLGLEDQKLILAALKRFEGCDGKHA